MIDVAAIMHHEVWFCESFTRKLETDYGVIFYNPDNPESHDSNHANIFRLDGDIDAILDDIVRVYRRRNLTPRIYNAYQEGELDVLRPHLEARGFTVQIHATTIFMLWHPTTIPEIDTPHALRRITQMSDDLIDLIHTDDEGDWTINVLKNHLHDERFHLLGLYDQGKCRAMASVKIMDAYSRVDDVKTHRAFRGRHLGTTLMTFLLAYHSQHSTNALYLYANNPIAIKLYRNIGFQELELHQQHWSAHWSEAACG